MSGPLPAVELVHATKRFNGTTAVDDISLTVAPGQLFGLIGPSGCGKTTLVRLLLGVLAPTEGTVQVMGHAPVELTPALRERIGYTPQGFFLYPTLTVIENASFVAGLFGMGIRRRRHRIREVLQFLELWEARHRLARDLSGGMQRRLELACALVHEPTVLFVDEPTAGLDPVLRYKIWEYLRTLRDQGTTVLVTTQYIDEANYCDTVAIMADGRILEVGAPDSLRQRAMGGDIVEVAAEPLGREEVVLLRELPGVRSVRWTERDALRLVVDDAARLTPSIIQLLQSRQVHVESVNPYEPSFEEVFMKIVGNHA